MLQVVLIGHLGRGRAAWVEVGVIFFGFLTANSHSDISKENKGLKNGLCEEEDENQDSKNKFSTKRNMTLIIILAICGTSFNFPCVPFIICIF